MAMLVLGRVFVDLKFELSYFSWSHFYFAIGKKRGYVQKIGSSKNHVAMLHLSRQFMRSPQKVVNSKGILPKMLLIQVKDL